MNFIYKVLGLETIRNKNVLEDKSLRQKNYIVYDLAVRADYVLRM